MAATGRVCAAAACRCAAARPNAAPPRRRPPPARPPPARPPLLCPPHRRRVAATPSPPPTPSAPRRRSLACSLIARVRGVKRCRPVVANAVPLAAAGRLHGRGHRTDTRREISPGAGACITRQRRRATRGAALPERHCARSSGRSTKSGATRAVERADGRRACGGAVTWANSWLTLPSLDTNCWATRARLGPVPPATDPCDRS